jgi:hypothetical protein
LWIRMCNTNCEGDAYLGGVAEGVQVLSQGFGVVRCDALGKFYD